MKVGGSADRNEIKKQTEREKIQLEEAKTYVIVRDS